MTGFHVASHHSIAESAPTWSGLLHQVGNDGAGHVRLNGRHRRHGGHAKDHVLRKRHRSWRAKDAGLVRVKHDGAGHILADGADPTDKADIAAVVLNGLPQDDVALLVDGCWVDGEFARFAHVIAYDM